MAGRERRGKESGHVLIMPLGYGYRPLLEPEERIMGQDW